MASVRWIALSAAPVLAAACDPTVYTNEISYVGNLEDVRDIYDSGDFYQEHIYTIIVGPESMGDNVLVSTKNGFSLPVNWGSSLSECDIDGVTTLSQSVSGAIVVQGRPSSDRATLLPSFVAVLSDFEIIETCGDPIEFINFPGAERYYRDHVQN